MGVKWTTVKNRFPDVEAAVKGLDGRSVKVGVMGGEHAWLAGIHEYGCKIPVTPKMRVWLHAHGLHLKPTTQYITIPERSFLRGGFDAKNGEVLSSAERLMPLVIDGSMSPEDFLETVGVTLSTAIKEYARDLDSPPNHPFTQDRKGSGNPLVDTGTMIESIGYEVE